jgi:monovalent cation:proton antiporter-2 (CPA2) family protein
MHQGSLELFLIFLLAAVVAVPLFKRMGLSAVLGYLFAGVAMGPHGLRLVTDPAAVLAFSEFGVVMMLFVIGLELSPSRLWVMRRSVFGAGGLQVALSAVLLGGLMEMLGVHWRPALVFGLGLALSSTAIGLQMLAERKELQTGHGRLGFAILLFQDLAAIPLLALIPLLASSAAAGRAPGAPLWPDALRALGIIAVVVVGGRLVLRQLFRAVAWSKMPEVFTATSLLVVVGTAWLMERGGLSMGLGAFLAGVLLADSEFRHELEAQVEPFKGLLLGLFFMAVGMSVDLMRVRAEPGLIAGAVGALVLVKALVLLLVGWRPGKLRLREALMLAAVLAMGGEFAFVVFTEAFRHGLIDSVLRDRVVAVVGLSMALSPLLVLAVGNWLVEHPEKKEERPADAIDHEHPRVIIAGFGRVGQIVGRVLRAARIPFTALEHSPEQVENSRRFGTMIYYGDPSRADLLRAAHVEQAEAFVLATDDPEASVRTARLLRRNYPNLKVFARARNRQHAFKLMDLGVHAVVRETLHSSLEMAQAVMESLGVPPELAAERRARFQAHDERMLREQYLIYDDEAALIANSEQARRDLEQLFEADAVPTPEELAEPESRPLPLD